MQSKIIAVDFDGTIVSHMYPKIGVDNPNAIRVLKKLIEQGHQLILWTMRSGRELDEAVAYCEDQGISFLGVNSNPNQSEWTTSPKQYAHLYIDDAALGCPTIFDPNTQRQRVNWRDVEAILVRTGYLIS